MKRQHYEIYNHRRVWRAACCNIDMLDRDYEGDFMEKPYFALAGMVLVFFAFEGYLNWLGELLFPDIWRNERAFFSAKNKPYVGTIGKLRYLGERLELSSFDVNSRPWKTVVELQDYRHGVAHPKSERDDRMVDDYSLPDGPAQYVGRLEAKATFENAKSCRDDVEEVVNLFHAQCLKLYPEKTPTAKPFSGLLAFSSTER